MHKPAFLGCTTPYDQSDIIIIGAPFDGTVSNRPGTKFAPNRIRLESWTIETYSPYQQQDLEDTSIHDAGDIAIPYGNTAHTMDAIYNGIASIVKDQKKPFMIGGEHLVSYPAIKAVTEQYPDLRVVHFDAHTDLRDTFFGEELSHATVLKKVTDILGDRRLYQFGIRSGTKEEFDYAREHQYLELADVKTIPTILPELQGHPIYITLDVDVLDPSVMPGTGTPEAGGITYKELLHALLQLKGLNIVGADIVEVSPDLDSSGSSTAVACVLVRELLFLLS
jgi:agmatinase